MRHFLFQTFSRPQAEEGIPKGLVPLAGGLGAGEAPSVLLGNAPGVLLGEAPSVLFII